MTKRFAIYFALPEESPLTRLATAWLGRDAFRTSTPAMELPRNGFSEETWRAVTSDPRVYGFHATLKPPFRMAPDYTEQELLAQVRAFARSRKAFTAPALHVSQLSSFLALTLSEPCPDFEALAADCVREFDQFRAPPLAEELARRRHPKLTVSQLESLDRWGYPYVLGDWRFHMTLTSSLEPPLFESIAAHLESLFSPHCREPFCVDSVCVFEQAGPGQPFHAIERCRFS